MMKLTEAIELWNQRNYLASEIFSVDDPEVSELINVEARYSQLVDDFSDYMDCDGVFDKIENMVKSSRQVIFHIMLMSDYKHKQSFMVDFISRNANKLVYDLEDVLRLCDEKVIFYFVDRILKVPLIDEQSTKIMLSSVIANNALIGDFFEYYVNDLNMRCSQIYRMLGFGCLVSKDFLQNEFYRYDEDSFNRAIISLSKLMLGEKSAFDYYKNAIDKRYEDGTLSYDLGRFGGASEIAFLKNVVNEVNDTSYLKDLLTGIGFTGDIGCVEILFKYLSHENFDVRVSASDAISEIVGYCDIDDSDNPLYLTSKWREWLQVNLDRFDDGVRYTRGDRFDLQEEARQMMNTDSASRKAIHQSLIIYTGQYFPFDEKRYWVDQVAQAKVWVDFIDRQNFPVGKWLFHGEVV